VTVDLTRYRLKRDLQAEIAELLARVEELKALLPEIAACEVEARRQAIQIVKPRNESWEN
jgi:hypothetical protein